MSRTHSHVEFLCLAIFALLPLLAGCNSGPGPAGKAPLAAVSRTATPQNAAPETSADAPPPEQTGGFDGNRAYEFVARQVAFGPRPSGSPAIAELQQYLISQLRSFGCPVDTDDFTSGTPKGRIAMKNIVVKIPGERPGIILLGTHYDTKRIANFVGADDGGSSTAVMLELARLLCPRHGRYAVWIAFFDGEEAVNLEWTDADSRYGSRELAARMALNGNLPKVRAFLLADIVGGKKLRISRESNSTKSLTDLVWRTAARLGYSGVFVNAVAAIDDDHQSFLRRGVPSVDVIDLENSLPYWHTPQDTLDKISAKSLAIVGHVFLETVRVLQSR